MNDIKPSSYQNPLFTRESLISPHTHQLKEHIRDFQCEMTFPKSRRDEIFIETSLKKSKTPKE